MPAAGNRQTRRRGSAHFSSRIYLKREGELPLVEEVGEQLAEVSCMCETEGSSSHATNGHNFPRISFRLYTNSRHNRLSLLTEYCVENCRVEFYMLMGTLESPVG